MADKLRDGGDPAGEDFPKGPGIGENVPEFSLPNQWGESVTYRPDGSYKALILFHRSADW